MTRAMLRRAALISAGLLFSAVTAQAVDGVLEINHTSALVTGYPVTLGPLSGSYRLTGNLTPPAGVSAINVAAPGIELDLNGFSIISPGGGAGVPGINGGPPGLVVHDGQITGFSGPGIILGPESKLFRLRISTNSGGGIGGAAICLIEDSVIVGNPGGPGIVADRCKLENNIVEGNGGPGILGSNNVIVHNRLVGNTAQGVNTPGDSVIAENAILGNTGDGILCPADCTIRGNTISSNGGNGASAGPGCSLTENNVRANGAIGLNLSPLAGYSNNTMTANVGVEVAPAAHPTDGFFNICDGAGC